MRVLLFCLLLLSASGKHNAGGAQKDSVVQKVIEMLMENKVKVADDLKKEEVEMSEFSQWCDDEADAKTYAIKTATRKTADLNAEIDDAAAQVRSLEDEVALLGREMAAKDKEMSEAKAVRKKDRENFSKTESAMLNTVAALEKAIILIKRSAGFLQTDKRPHSAKAYAKQLADALRPIVNAAWVDKGSIQVLKGFIQDRDQEGSGSDSSDDLQLHMSKPAEEAEASGGIMQVLEDMKEKAQETLSNARMEEMKTNHNYEMMTASLENALSLAKTKLSDCKGTKASLTEQSGKAQGELAETKKSKMTDELYLDSLKQECTQAANEWAERQKSATAEMAAIDKAKEILQSKVKVLVQFPEDDGAPADDASQAATRRRLVDELQGMGHKFNSYAMMEMASAATQDPFSKIRGLIEDMIAKLVAEANEEATQHDFCNQEKAKSKKEQDAKMLRMDDLKSRIDSATSAKETLSEKIKELQAEIAEITSASAEATKIRNEEAATNKKAIKDFKDGASAVEEAIRVLKEYYASNPPSLIQTRKGGPSFAQAKGDAATTIVGFLETSAEDFSRMATEAETDEGEAAAAYEKTMEENKASKASKTEEIKGAESEIKVLSVTIEGDNEDLKMVNKELDAVMGYIEKLKPQCETKAMTYEEKKAKRQEEIEGLKEALSILDAPGAAAFAQVKKH